MAFAITVTSPMKGAERISRSLGVYAGKVSITSYAQTLVECTAITKYFVPTGNATTGGFKDGVVSVQIDGPSDSGYLARWDQATGAFRCFYTVNSTQSTLTLAASATVSGLGTVFVSTASSVIGHTGTAHAINISAIVAAPATEALADVTIGTF